MGRKRRLQLPPLPWLSLMRLSLNVSHSAVVTSRCRRGVMVVGHLPPPPAPLESLRQSPPGAPASTLAQALQELYLGGSSLCPPSTASEQLDIT